MRKKRTTKSEPESKGRFMTSVYPDPSVFPILGGSGSRVFTDAIHLWALTLQRCTRDNEEKFDPEQWRALAAVLGDEGLPTRWVAVPEMLASQIEHLQKHENIGATLFAKDGERRMLDLAFEVRKMGYEHALAALWAVRWARETPGVDLAADEWWTLQFRAGRTPPAKP